MAKIIGQQESLNVSTVIYLANEKSANRPPLVWLFRTHLNCTDVTSPKLTILQLLDQLLCTPLS